MSCHCKSDNSDWLLELLRGKSVVDILKDEVIKKLKKNDFIMTLLPEDLNAFVQHYDMKIENDRLKIRFTKDDVASDSVIRGKNDKTSAVLGDYSETNSSKNVKRVFKSDGDNMESVVAGGTVTRNVDCKNLDSTIIVGNKKYKMQEVVMVGKPMLVYVAEDAVAPSGVRMAAPASAASNDYTVMTINELALNRLQSFFSEITNADFKNGLIDGHDYYYKISISKQKEYINDENNFNNVLTSSQSEIYKGGFENGFYYTCGFMDGLAFGKLSLNVNHSKLTGLKQVGSPSNYQWGFNDGVNYGYKARYTNITYN